MASNKAPKPANQGGVAKANVAPTRTSGTPKNVGATSTPGLGGRGDYIKHTSGVGGSGTTAASPKPFKK